jgi:hypothetical protein
LHDAITAERKGVPAAGVMTTQFVSAADMMCRVHGMPDYKYAIIEHPISSASDNELRAKAESTAEQVAQLLLKA